MASTHQLMAFLFLFLASSCTARPSLVEELDDMGIVSVLERGVNCDIKAQLEATLKRSQQHGGQGGDKRDIDNINDNPPLSLVSATIYHDYHVITALSFEYRTLGGKTITVGPWGQTRYAKKTEKVNFRQGERVLELVGTSGDYNDHEVIKSLGFVTDQRELGPYGENRGTPFSIEASGRIVAFFGRSGHHLDAIGAYYYT